VNIDQRDLTIIQLLNRFGMLSSAHIRELVFFDLKSSTSYDRTIKRLLSSRYIARVERRLVGGQRGGSGVFCYCLGAEGWRLCSREGRYQLPRSINYHSLAIADVYVTLRRLERDGKLQIAGYLCEPVCHVTIDKYKLTPDLFVELRLLSGQTVRRMVEVDQGSEGQRQLTEKLERYAGAYQKADETTWPPHQLVLWIAPDDHRLQELAWLIGRMDENDRHLFRALTLDGLTAALSA
jgi:hypothetical protein